MKSITIPRPTADATTNLALDTISIGKQALIFVNTKPSAEKEAEEIAKKSKKRSPDLMALAEDVRNALSKPTKQCERLAWCVERGIAFHHAGLASKQKDIVEEAFRSGNISIICSTPTLAAGLDLPAYRAIIKDLKRYGGSFGMTSIPVLEYLQMAGRAGRPKFDTKGEAICIAKSDSEKNDIYFKYVTGEPEAIYSKLAVEPVLRTYLLSLISTGFVSTDDQIMEFFSKTFWAHQFHDMAELSAIIAKTLRMLEEWGFLESTMGKVTSGFISADEIQTQSYKATQLGRRVSELYLDPYTAHHFCTGIKKCKAVELNEVSFLQLVSGTLEMRPALTVRTKEYDLLQEKSALVQPYLLHNEPSLYDSDYDEFLESLKCTILLSEWIDEKDEQFLLETYNVRPGELRAKLEVANWLLFGVGELARIMGHQEILKHVNKTKMRLKYGVKEELLALLKLEGVGRVRSRKLFHAGLKDLGVLRDCDLTTLSQLVGPSLAASIKQQLGVEVGIVPRGTRKGQLSLKKY
ncbi:MAG: helicase-related protein [Nanoarchaeota archaeon]